MKAIGPCCSHSERKSFSRPRTRDGSLCLGAVRQGGPDTDQLYRLRVQHQRKRRLAQWPHLVQ